MWVINFIAFVSELELGTRNPLCCTYIHPYPTKQHYTTRYIAQTHTSGAGGAMPMILHLIYLSHHIYSQEYLPSF